MISSPFDNSKGILLNTGIKDILIAEDIVTSHSKTKTLTAAPREGPTGVFLPCFVKFRVSELVVVVIEIILITMIKGITRNIVEILSFGEEGNLLNIETILQDGITEMNG